MYFCFLLLVLQIESLFQERGTFLFAACLCRQATAEQYLASIARTSVLRMDVSQMIVFRLLEENLRLSSDGDVQLDDSHHYVSLRCPSTLQRIAIPGRGIGCR